MAYDPWQQYNQGLQSLGENISTLKNQQMVQQENARRNSLQDLQVKQAEIGMADTQARQKALMAATGASTPEEAYQKQLAEEKKAKLLDLQFKQSEEIKRYKDAGATPEFLKDLTKLRMKQYPETAPMSDFVSYVDDSKVEITKPFKENELKNPLTGTFMPAGTYKVVSRATGNPAEPYKFDKIEPVKQEKPVAPVHFPAGSMVQQPDGTYKQIGTPARAASSGNSGKPAQPAKPLPIGALKLQNEATDAIALASGLETNLSVFKNQLDNNQLNLGLFKNIWNQGRNFTGQSTPESRNLQEFKANLEKMRNDSLKLNKGVQTEGDAVRAWKEMIDNLNDEEVVKQRLNTIINLNATAVALKDAQINNIRENYGLPPLDTTVYKSQPASVGRQSAPAAKPAPAAIKSGTIEDGYKFRGGNPANPKNWVKVGS